MGFGRPEVSISDNISAYWMDSSHFSTLSVQYLKSDFQIFPIFSSYQHQNLFFVHKEQQHIETLSSANCSAHNINLYFLRFILFYNKFKISQTKYLENLWKNQHVLKMLLNVNSPWPEQIQTTCRCIYKEKKTTFSPLLNIKEKLYLLLIRLFSPFQLRSISMGHPYPHSLKTDSLTHSNYPLDVIGI